MTRWYNRYYDKRWLWWLHTSPGQGGRLHRNKFCEKQAKDWAA